MKSKQKAVWKFSKELNEQDRIEEVAVFLTVDYEAKTMSIVPRSHYKKGAPIGFKFSGKPNTNLWTVVMQLMVEARQKGTEELKK